MMRKLFLPLVLALLTGTFASAKLHYTFKDTVSAYVPLGGSASLLTGSAPWDAYSRNYVAPMPFSWNMDSAHTLSSLPLIMGFPSTCADTDDYSDVNGFLFADLTELTDRGINGNVSLSPVRYSTSGTAPVRIFKLEFANAGFAYERQFHNTLNDSINVQIWIYEGSSIVELHYGRSKITYPSDYFATANNQVLIGYLQHVDFVAGSQGLIYYLKGSSAANTGIDSISITSPTPPSNNLSGWPDSGRVFRFTPTRPACTPPVANFNAAAPVGNNVSFTYTGTTNALDSLVWDFGDGTKQKVTSAYTVPIAHTYATNGKYNTSVTAYNACGSATSNSKQSAVSVGSVANLRGVKVYPNPARNFLTIEGMYSGTATVLSLSGQILLRSEVTNAHESLNITALPAGTYNLLLQGADGATGAMPFSKL